jgi:hypothetical protein
MVSTARRRARAGETGEPMSRKARTTVRFAPLLVALTALAPIVSGGATGESPAREAERSRVHADPGEVARAFVLALEALLDEEPARAKAALDRVAAASPPVVAEAHRDLGTTVVDADRAFQKLLTMAREEANGGNNALAFQYHQGLQRTCLQCHDYARKDGVFVRAEPAVEGEP